MNILDLDCLKRLQNWVADNERRMRGAGPRWEMYKRLARDLVDKGDWFWIPLDSGTQIPLIDALLYLAEISDRKSIPRLKKLVKRYTAPSPNSKNEDEWRACRGGGFVKALYGPADEIPKEVQRRAIESLLRLLSLPEAKKYTEELFDEIDIESLDWRTIKTLTGFIEKNKMAEFSSRVLKLGKTMKFIFDGCSKSFNSLYGYEELVFCAFNISEENAEKKEAWWILIEEYNHPDGYDKYKRSHDRIDLILCEIVDRERREGQSRTEPLLDQRRLAKDMPYYRKHY